MKGILLTVLALGPSLSSCSMCSSGSKEESSPSSPSTALLTAPEGAKSSEPEELKIDTLKEGSGNTVAVSGKKITVHYTGRLTDGKVFDSSEQRQAPYAFVLGAGQVMAGWEKGISGMKVGERRKLVIPAHLAYGDKGVGNVIPPRATLVFEVELLNVE